MTKRAMENRSPIRCIYNDKPEGTARKNRAIKLSEHIKIKKEVDGLYRKLDMLIANGETEKSEVVREQIDEIINMRKAIRESR